MSCATDFRHRRARPQAAPHLLPRCSASPPSERRRKAAPPARRPPDCVIQCAPCAYGETTTLVLGRLPTAVPRRFRPAVLNGSDAASSGTSRGPLWQSHFSPVVESAASAARPGPSTAGKRLPMARAASRAPPEWQPPADTGAPGLWAAWQAVTLAAAGVALPPRFGFGERSWGEGSRLRGAGDVGWGALAVAAAYHARARQDD